MDFGATSMNTQTLITLSHTPLHEQVKLKRNLKAYQLAMFNKPEIQITLDSSSTAFSTLDSITGNVSVTVKSPTTATDIHISLRGRTKSFINDPSSMRYADTEAIHPFLRLIQPVSNFPADGVLQPGQTYVFPFVFVVPQHLLPRACVHSIASNSVRDSHLQLPPSLGDKSANGDDMAPRSVEISYSIVAVLQKWKKDRKVSIVDTSKKIHIRPSTEELPPISVDDTDDFNFRATKVVRKGFFHSKQGTLVIETSQPNAFSLAPLDCSEPPIPNTHLRLCLRFDPACDKVTPPTLASVASKLHINTFWATTARKDMARKVKHPWMDLTSDSLTETLGLGSYSTSGVEWVARRERDSTCSMGEEFPAPSAGYNDGKFFTAKMLIPLSLPSCNAKSLVPTFHSCLVSRTYSIQLSVSLSSTSLPVTINVPVQISASPSASLVDRDQQEALAAVAALEADDQFDADILGPGWMMRRAATMDSMASTTSPPAYENLFSGGFARVRTNGSVLT
jgi:hypothetical protein